MNAQQGRSAVPDREAPPPALTAVLDRVRAEPDGWDEADRLQELAEHLAAAVDVDHAFIVRIHDSLRPPPVTRIAASAVRRPPGYQPLEGAGPAIDCFADAFARLGAGQVLDTSDAAEQRPGVPLPFAGMLVPVVTGTTLWGALALTESGRNAVADRAARHALQRIAETLARRLQPGAAAAVEASRSADRYLGAALDLIAEPLSVYNGDLRAVRYNKAWRQMLAHVRPGEDLHGVALIDIYRAHIERGLWTVDYADEMFRDIASGRYALNRERIAHVGGRYKRSRVYAMPGGGFVSIHNDINELVERQRELVQAKEEAELASRAKSTFLANISHELRTPLNAIIGFSDVMVREIFGALPNDRYRDYAKDIHDSGNLLLSLINDILDMARIEAGRFELKPQSMALEAPLREVLRMVELRVAAKGQDLLVPDGATLAALPPVMADRRATIQILLNLIGNAIKFTPKGGAITVVAQTQGTAVRMAVVDTGPGIDESLMARIGRPFEQAGNLEVDITRENQGTGLGLAIARALAERQGGQLSITSIPGEGTTVAFTLPIAAA